MSLQVNTRVVEALMRLRGFTRKSLAQVAGVRLENMNAWMDANDGSDLYVSRVNQAEILHALGVTGEGLRKDCVHHWQLTEGYFTGLAAYRDVQIMLHAFGEALAVTFQKDSESALSFSGRQVFGLRFAEACVVLEVNVPVFKSVSFNPEKMSNIKWAFDEFVALVTEEELERLLASDMTPAEFDDYATGKAEAEKWSRLHLVAREYGISPDDVEKWMVAKAKASEAKNALGVQEGMSLKKVANGESMQTAAPDFSQMQKPAQAKKEPLKKQSASVTNIEDYRLFTDTVNSSN